MKNTFSERIRILRSKMNMNQFEFANYIGIKQPSLSAYERGISSPTMDGLTAIAEKCNVSLDWLCGISPRPLYETVADIISSILGIAETVDGDCSVKVCDNTISFDFSEPSGNDTKSSVSAEITSFFKEYAEMKERLSSLPDKEFSDFAKDYYDMWLEKKLAYYATMPVHTKNEDV